MLITSGIILFDFNFRIASSSFLVLFLYIVVDFKEKYMKMMSTFEKKYGCNSSPILVFSVMLTVTNRKPR